MVRRSVIISQPASSSARTSRFWWNRSNRPAFRLRTLRSSCWQTGEITRHPPRALSLRGIWIGLYATGDNHQPSGVFLPFQQHSRATRMMRLQLNLDKPTSKRAWATIVQIKINNQAFVLRNARQRRP